MSVKILHGNRRAAVRSWPKVQGDSRVSLSPPASPGAACSILIPHLDTEMNTRALSLAMESIDRHTHRDYEVVVDTGKECPYRIWNRIVDSAENEILVFSNSDIVFAEGWDLMVDYVDDHSIVAGYLVEPGSIKVADANIHRDFGREPDSFDVGAFDRFAAAHGNKVPALKLEAGWHMPCAMTRSFFVKHGRFPVDKGVFPFQPLDAMFRDRAIAGGAVLRRVRSYAYHFQRLSRRP